MLKSELMREKKLATVTEDLQGVYSMSTELEASYDTTESV